MIVQGNAPIYESVANYFRKMISLKVLKEGDPLPSVREIAISEGINPNTVVRSYAILVDEGLVTSVPKKGYFVAKGQHPIDHRSLKKALGELLSLGYSKQDIAEALSELEDKQND